MLMYRGMRCGGMSREALGDQGAEMLIQFAARGPLTMASAGALYQPARGRAQAQLNRTRAVPQVATMYATM